MSSAIATPSVAPSMVSQTREISTAVECCPLTSSVTIRVNANAPQATSYRLGSATVYTMIATPATIQVNIGACAASGIQAKPIGTPTSVPTIRWRALSSVPWGVAVMT